MLSKLPKLRKDEKIALILRRDKLYYLKHITALIILIAIPFCLYFLGKYFFPNLIETPSFNIIFILLTSVYLCFSLLFSYISWLNYYLDIWVITNLRIIEYEQKSLFHRVTSELTLLSIEDVTAQIKGVLPSIFHFGTIYVQTAGATERFIFKDAPDPEKAKKIIMDIHNKLIYQ